jgi:hypothetical protein
VQRLDVVTGWLEGLEPEQHWRVMVVALALLFLLGVLIGAVEGRGGSAAEEASAARGAPRVEARL